MVRFPSLRRAPRAIATTVRLPAELRHEVERVRDELRAEDPEVTLGDAVRTCVAAGAEALKQQKAG